MSGNALTAVGTLFQRWNGFLWESIAEIKAIVGPDVTKDVIDTTSLDTNEGTREFTTGFMDGGKVTLAMSFTRDGYEVMKEDFEDTAYKDYCIQFPDEEQTLLNFYGLVTKLPLGIVHDNKVDCNIEIKVVGGIEDTAEPIEISSYDVLSVSEEPPIEESESDQEWVSYWVASGLFLFFAQIKNITSDDKLYNEVSGATDFLSVTGDVGSESFQCPDTSNYEDADTDNLWFDSSSNLKSVTTVDLVAYDFERTIVHYDNASPYNIQWIAILKGTTELTDEQVDDLHTSFDLSLFWSGVSNENGVFKGNRALIRSVY